jgi:hypothetical protein
LVHTTTRKSWEERFVSEYTLEKFPRNVIMLRCPLGEIPTEMQETHGTARAARWFRPARPVCDAIVIDGTRLVLIEGKIFNVRDGIGALLTYRPLVPYTPELEKYKRMAVVLRLVTARPPQWAIRSAEFNAVEIDVFQPPWIDDYYAHMEAYWTREHRLARQQRKEALKSLGYEKEG